MDVPTDSSLTPALTGEAVETSADSGDPAMRYFNRELSWLAFNRRVLAEARNSSYPLLERLRFLSISGSNLDEFMMIRVAGLEAQVRRGIGKTSIDGKTPSQQLTAIRREYIEIEKGQQAALADLRGRLAHQGVHIADETHLAPGHIKWLREWFEDQVLPVLTPQAIDPAHPFPFVANLGMGVIFNLVRKSDGEGLVEMVLIPAGIPRFVRLPGEDRATWVPVESLVTRFAPALFPGFEIVGDGVFRVIRDSDIEVEEEAEDLVRYFRTAIQRRRRGRVVLLELDQQCDPEAEKLLREQLGVEGAMVIKTDGMLGLRGLSQVVDEDRPDLKFAAFSPRYPERVMEHDGDCFAAIREKDMIIHHPYESFEVVVDFLRQAASDPAVLSIKQTLYRAGNQSPVIQALTQAAENGKSVTAVVELKARFDEEQNLKWAGELERAGVQVIYGFTEWKTHAKVSMVMRREEDGIRTYCHFGTGNYHPVTANIYTDLSYFTADPKLARDAGKLFNFVTGYVEPRKTEALAISPIDLRETLYEAIDREIENARAGRPAGIWAKLNSITEKGMIDRLYEASQAGVEIELVIRGICCLRPGVPGLSENIHVKSIIGRFLEHSRIWAFANGYALPSARANVWISSADAMSRNLTRRVEALVPLRNRTVHNQVLDQVLVANLLDNERSWTLDASGDYTRVERGDAEGFNVHDYFMRNPSLSGRGGAGIGAVPKLSLRRGRA
ncbi:RNA degradosome polyphosphate kinase [Altererythrobacter sp. FM1]|uniref:Polyphosphate kinase n=1 Tax=Tsuneonella flava TaxID=2055955 RepID=A0ABX7KBH4_9SPHN|nr:RNA degradosome polyphosphate kinase [Tsuneonella flava]QSB45621.1 RNA degradosome polyphosphate kinase [Tsuneonella flava]ROT97216.1 RNA degradosome polyphosphate kinase [Altererythrobacter sp. FM1]